LTNFYLGVHISLTRVWWWLRWQRKRRK